MLKLKCGLYDFDTKFCIAWSFNGKRGVLYRCKVPRQVNKIRHWFKERL